MRHDEHSIKSVRAKIAMFSNEGKTSSQQNLRSNSSSSLAASSLTRSLTQGDVRFDQDAAAGRAKAVAKNSAYHRSMINVSKSSKDSDLARVSNTENKNGRPPFALRSQSLLEIGGTGDPPKPSPAARVVTDRSQSSSALLPGASESSNLIESRRRTTLTKMKGLVIPETSTPTVLKTPPWKVSGGSSPNSATLPKYSPAFKRKPFTIYSHNTAATPPTTAKPSPNKEPAPGRPRTSKSDDSDNDSAVSSARSSLSHSSSVSPPHSPQISNGRKETEANNKKNILESKAKKTSAPETEGKVPIKERRSISSTRTPLLGKPASRSSSFTIAERKKSFEAFRLSGKGSQHSSQDSISTVKSCKEDSPFSRRSSTKSDILDGSRVTTPTALRNTSSLTDAIREMDNESKIQRTNSMEKWTSLEKKYTERPKDLFIGNNAKKMSAKSPGSIKELTEKWENRSTEASTPLADSPPTFSRRSTQDTLVMSPASSTRTSREEQVLPKFVDAPWGTKSSLFMPPPEVSTTEWIESPARSLNATPTNSIQHSTPNSLPLPGPPERKYSVPAYPSQENKNSSVKMRDKTNSVPSRPSSLIETGGQELKVFEIGNLGNTGQTHHHPPSTSTSRGSSQADLLECGASATDTPKSPLPGSSSRELLEVFGKASEGSSSSVGGGSSNGRRCVSVNDIRRAFEKAEQSLASSVKGQGMSPSHNRMSSLDSTTSDESSIPTPHNYYGSVSSLISGRENLKDHYGSITSLASSTSLISPQVNFNP